MIDYNNNGFYKKSAYIDVTTKCTLQCSVCERKEYDYKSHKISGGDTSIDDWRKITDYFSHIILNGAVGDPIFNPNLIEMLKIAKEKDVDISISNAASHKPMKWYQEAFDANEDVQWRFSVDGLPHQSFIYRINQDGEYLFEVMKECRKRGMDARWQYLVFKYNEDYIQDAIKLANENDLVIEINHTDSYEEEYKPTKNSDKYMKDRKFSPRCLNGNKWPYISTEGQVLPCCWVDDEVPKKYYRGEEVEDRLTVFLDKKLNIKNNNVNNIMNSDIFIDFYNDIINNNIPELCKRKCSSSRRFNQRHIETYYDNKLVTTTNENPIYKKVYNGKLSRKS